MDEKTRITAAQIDYLRERFDVVDAEFAGGVTLLLRRRNDKMLKVDTVRKMLGLKESNGWTQEGKWVQVYI